MKKKLFFYFIFLFLTAVVYAGETYSGWVKTVDCWVVARPDKDAAIIGTIKQRSSVMVERLGEGWLKIVFAPVRDPGSGNLVVCQNCYIESHHITALSPDKW